MAHTAAGLRATSLAASAALLGAAVLAAMTMRFTMAAFVAPPDIASVEIVRPDEPKPPAPTPPDVRRPPPPDDPIVIAETPTLIDVAEAVTITETPTIFTAPGPQEISNPHWTRRPRDLGRFYPTRARSSGIEGEVVLDCLVSTLGALSCNVARETPLGWGFGDAAQRIAREHRMAPALRDGQPIEARYRMRLPFQLD